MTIRRILSLTLLIFLAILIAGVDGQSTSYLESRRVSIASRSAGQQITIPFNSTTRLSVGVVLSLASLTEGTRIAVKLVRQNSGSFVVEVSRNLNAFSYLLVEISEYCNVGQLSALYLPPSLAANSSQLEDTLVPVTGFNQLLEQFGTVQPFISQLVYQPTSLVPTTILNLNWIWNTSSINISRSADITKVTISYLIYIKLGSSYINIVPPTGTHLFIYSSSQQPIFTGTRKLNLYKNAGQSYYFTWTGALTADLSNAELNTLLVMINSTRCNGTLVAVNNSANMLSCQAGCLERLVTIGTLSICIRNSSNYSSTMANLTLTSPVTQLLFSPTQICSSSRITPNSLYCTQCNTANHYSGTGIDGSCFCEQGYYYYNFSCYQCTDITCAFFMEAKLDLITIEDNSTEMLNISVNVNRLAPWVRPQLSYSYAGLGFDIYINNVKVPYQVNATSTGYFSIRVSKFAYSQSYNLRLKIRNSILLNNNNSQLYLSPQSTLTLVYNHTETAKLVASSMQAIGNAAPFAALVSIVLGSKINLFSFMQVSSTLYLSSYIRWQNYGSINRISLSQSLFKLTPTNFFATLGTRLPVPKLYSDDLSANNLMLSNNQYQLYISVAPEFLLSTLMQILLIQMLFRLMALLFPPAGNHNCEIDKQGRIRWVKKSFLVQFMESSKADTRTKLSELATKIQQKRHIFYTSMISSQLVYHSFTIFSQFKINVSTVQQLANTFSCIGLMGMMVVFSCLGPHSPMVLFKSIGIVYKKRDYTLGGLFLCYVMGMAEMVFYGASVALFENSMEQCAGVVVILTMKLIFLRSYIKVIELIKNCLLLGFFITLGLGTFFPKSIQSSMQIASIGLMMGVCLIELLKILRSFMVLILGFLKEPPSIKGKAIIKRIEQHRRQETQS